MKRDAHMGSSALRSPSRLGHGGRPIRAERAPAAPPDNRGWDPRHVVTPVNPDRLRVFAESKADASDHAPACWAGEPGRRYEPDWVEAELAQMPQPALDALSRMGFIERDELAFPRRATPGAQGIWPPAREADLVVTLAVQKHLGSLVRAGTHPAGKRRRALQRRVTVPVGYDEERRGDSTGSA